MVWIGARVEVCGLKNDDHYNNQQGVVQSQSDDRYEVLLDSGKRLKVLEENLIVLVSRTGAESQYQSQPQYSEQQSPGSVAHRSPAPQNPVTDLGVAMFSGAAKVAKRHWRVTLTWVVGIFLACFATGFAVSEDEALRYETMLQAVDTERLMKAEMRAHQTDHQYRASQGWFSCDERCTVLKQSHEAAVAELNEAQAEVEHQIGAARSSVGIFSTYGVQEARDLFWKRFSQGKQFAKRQSMWDLMFAGLFSMGRDESLASFALRFLIQVLMNFTIGVIGASIAFIWSLWSVVQSFHPGYLQGALFFLLATIAACSFMVTWLVGLYAAAAGGVLVVGTAASNMRIEDRSRGPRRVNSQQRGRPYDGYED